MSAVPRKDRFSWKLTGCWVQDSPSRLVTFPLKPKALQGSSSSTPWSLVWKASWLPSPASPLPALRSNPVLLSRRKQTNLLLQANTSSLYPLFWSSASSESSTFVFCMVKKGKTWYLGDHEDEVRRCTENTPHRTLRYNSCQLQTGTCHLPLQGLSAAATDFPHPLKGVQGGEQKWAHSVLWEKLAEQVFR